MLFINGKISPYAFFNLCTISYNNKIFRSRFIKRIKPQPSQRSPHDSNDNKHSIVSMIPFPGFNSPHCSGAVALHCRMPPPPPPTKTSSDLETDTDWQGTGARATTWGRAGFSPTDRRRSVSKAVSPCQGCFGVPWTCFEFSASDLVLIAVGDCRRKSIGRSVLIFFVGVRQLVGRRERWRISNCHLFQPFSANDD